MQTKYFTQNKKPLKAHRNITLVNAINQVDWDRFITKCDRLEKLMSELVSALSPKTQVQTIAPEVLKPAQHGK